MRAVDRDAAGLEALTEQARGLSGGIEPHVLDLQGQVDLCAQHSDVPGYSAGAAISADDDTRAQGVAVVGPHRDGATRHVLLGEASHGTMECYRWRAVLTRQLIEEKGFSFVAVELVAVEGDWPDCLAAHQEENSAHWYVTERAAA